MDYIRHPVLRLILIDGDGEKKKKTHKHNKYQSRAMRRARTATARKPARGSFPYMDARTHRGVRAPRPKVTNLADASKSGREPTGNRGCKEGGQEGRRIRNAGRND